MMIARAALMALVPVLVLTACTSVPPSRERAAALCREEARQADGVSGRIGVGTGSAGPSTSGTITITNRVFNPVSEADALNACIARRMGGQPTPRNSGLTVGITLSAES
jgi:ABC-type glycerol-3-phosphate transport system substrate-binding protein